MEGVMGSNIYVPSDTFFNFEIQNFELQLLQVELEDIEEPLRLAACQ